MRFTGHYLNGLLYRSPRAILSCRDNLMDDEGVWLKEKGADKRVHLIGQHQKDVSLFKGETEKYSKGRSRAACTEGTAKDLLQLA